MRRNPDERRGYERALEDAEVWFRHLIDEYQAKSRDESRPVTERQLALGEAAGLAAAVNWCMWRPLHLEAEEMALAPKEPDQIETVKYQAQAAAANRPCGCNRCVDEFPGMPSRWCSGCLIDALLSRLRSSR